MKTTMIRGVPARLQRDGWWMDGYEPRRKNNRGRRGGELPRPLLLIALIAMGDTLLWQVIPGLSLAVFVLALIAAALLTAQSLSFPRAFGALFLALLSVLPVIELVQPLSLVLLAIGLCLTLCCVAKVGPESFLRAAARYPLVASRQGLIDLRDGVRSAGQMPAPSSGEMRDVVTGWAVPVFLGLVFITLLSGANPILQDLLSELMRLDWPEPDFRRYVFWLMIAGMCWCALIATKLRAQLTVRKPARHTVRRPGLINARSVTRSLVLFNALFAIQTAMDLLFLYGAQGLPAGMSYAEYAHRGAYPLLATALLAGLFGILARPHTDEAPALRWLLFLWLAQTLALVAASLTRLEIYVDVYGLTRFRMAAAIWMCLVMVGLGLMLVQTTLRLGTAWFLYRASGLSLATLYACAFLNFDGTIAWYNLTRDVERDSFYLCHRLSDGAAPSIVKYADPPLPCNTYARATRVSPPQDWREWGFRNWRLRRNLAALKTEVVSK